MPRDSSGNYTLPPSNPVVNGTVIEPAWANSTMQDIAVQLNNVVTRDGVVGITGALGIPDGSAGSPGLFFRTDPDVGLYRSASNTLGISANNTQVASFTDTMMAVTAPLSVAPAVLPAGISPFRVSYAGATGLQVDGGGNVGIGMDANQQANTRVIEAASGGTQGAVLFLHNTASGSGLTKGLMLQSTNIDSMLWNWDNTPLRFATNSAERMRISAAGNVGIGLDAPGYKLEVKGAANVLALRGSDESGVALMATFNDTASGVAQFWLAHNLADVNLGNTRGALAFFTNNVERARLTGGGYFGLGTLNPGAPIHVKNASAVIVNESTANVGATAGCYYSFRDNGGDCGYVGFGGGEANRFDIVNYRGAILFHAAGSERMRIPNAAGPTVLIGTTSPIWASGARGDLEIAGSGSALLGLRAGAAGQGYFYHDATNLVLLGTPGDVFVNAGGNNRLQVGADGYVRILANPPVGDNSNIAAATSWVQAMIPGGINRSYVNAGKSYNTLYTNTAGRPIMVGISVALGTGIEAQVQVNGVMVQHVHNTSAGMARFSLFFIVPQGATYQLVGTASTLDMWVEC